MTPPEEIKVYNVSTLALIVFKTLRAERNMHQTYIAEHLGLKSVSAWTKIENGQSPLTMDAFFHVCHIFQVPASQVISVTEQIAIYLGRVGFYPREMTSTADDLMPLVRDFFNKPIMPSWNQFASSWYPNSIMSNWPLSGELPEIIRYLTEPEYRAEKP